MPALERICPNCGMTNSADRTYCVRCNTNLITLARRGPANLPARVDKAQAAAVVVGVSALIARVALNRLARGGLPINIGSALKRAVPRRERQLSEDRTDYIVRGWRTWAVYRGEERSSGSEQFEWRIKRSK